MAAIVCPALGLAVAPPSRIHTRHAPPLRSRQSHAPAPTASAPNLQGGTHVSELVTLEGNERVLCLTTLAETSLGLALGTARGVVKRVNPEVLGRDAWEVIRLEPGDTVVGAVELTSESHELTFITNDAQLLHFPAASVRPSDLHPDTAARI